MGRVDCLTEHYAIEVDFADKWAEGIGQAYLYAAVFERRPGVVYIIEDANDCKHYEKSYGVAGDATAAAFRVADRASQECLWRLHGGAVVTDRSSPDIA